jgi:hypothetical protein
MYSDIKIGNNLIRRNISASSAAKELTWHRDENDRQVKVVMSEGWSLQRDNSLPSPIRAGDIINIKAREWHRVIPGKGDLVITIKESKKKIATSKSIQKKSKLLTDLISELIQEPDSIDLQGNEDVEAFQTSSLSDEEGKMLVSEDDLLEALIVLRQGARR